MEAMKMPEMRVAMHAFGKKILNTSELSGLSGAMLVEMGADGEFVEPHHFAGDEWTDLRGFMRSAKARLHERIEGGAVVVLLGVTVLVHDDATGPLPGNITENLKALSEAGVETLLGAAVFGVNRMEFAADIYTRTGERAATILTKSKRTLVQKLAAVGQYFFQDNPWPTVH